MIFLIEKKAACGEHIIPEDKYKSYNELSQNEFEEECYSITVRSIAGNSVTILAPHGGGIESSLLNSRKQSQEMSTITTRLKDSNKMETAIFTSRRIGLMNRVHWN